MDEDGGVEEGVWDGWGLRRGGSCSGGRGSGRCMGAMGGALMSGWRTGSGEGGRVYWEECVKFVS